MDLLNRGIKFAQSQIRMRVFERKVHPATWRNHASILDWAMNYDKSNVDINLNESAIIQRGRELRSDALTHFKNKYQSLHGIRILIHVPSKVKSPGGYSLFTNLMESIEYLGVPCEKLEWGESIGKKLSQFKPTIFLSSDNEIYISRIDWSAIQRYRNSYGALKVGLTASIEAYGNTPLEQRLNWAKNQRINFYYSFRSQEYIKSREEYKPFFKHGYKLFSIEFGANPLHYYPVDRIERDISYVFLASSNPDKQERYAAWLTPIVERNAGFLDGPGWTRLKHCAPKSVHSYLYARAKIGINLHIDDSIDWASELNERTYILAACGVPQLIDNPKLLLDRFSEGAMFCASSPTEYKEMFEEIMASPSEADKRTMLALEQVYKRHTTFHRAEEFINQICLL